MADNAPEKEVRRELYEIFRNNTPFEEKARDALVLGERYLGADNGHFSRIDRANNHWQVMVSTDPPDGQFPLGVELDLRNTYCRKTMESADPITLHDAPNQGWADDPAFEKFGLHTYHGTTLIPSETHYGTVCFVSEAPRRNPFSDDETMMAELITRLIERDLSRVQLEGDLTRYINLSTVLNRVLRHNLRNDLSVIRGFTELTGDKLDDGTDTDRILNMIDRLFELSNKARELERMASADYELESTELGELVQKVVDDYTKEYPSASISVNYDYGITVPVFPSFSRAVEELINNAAKHSEESPTITVTIEPVPYGGKVVITDKGPGLDEDEVRVLETGIETPLSHGSGLGLWMTYWIISSHGGSVNVTSADAGSTITIKVPERSDTVVSDQLAKITQARDQYQEAFDNAPDAMAIINDDAQIVNVNSEAANLYGGGIQELLGTSIATFLSEDVDFEAEWQQFQAEGRKRETVTIVGGDGEERRVEYAAATDVIPGKHLIISRECIDQQQT